MRTKKNHRIVRRTKYSENFNIDISKENIGVVFEVICHAGNKFKVEVVDPKNHQVRVTSKGNNNVKDFVVEGQITTSKGIRASLSPYCSLPAPKNTTFAIIIEKMRRL